MTQALARRRHDRCTTRYADYGQLQTRTSCAAGAVASIADSFTRGRPLQRRDKVMGELVNEVCRAIAV